jgi:hypothetical protein
MKILVAVDANNAGTVTEWLINRGTERIRRAANAISLKNYSSCLRVKRSAGVMTGSVFAIRSRVVSVNVSSSEFLTSDLRSPSQVSTNDFQLLGCR